MADVTVETTPEDTASGRPFRAKCAECGWQSWGYVNIHAAQNLADGHRCDHSTEQIWIRRSDLPTMREA